MNPIALRERFLVPGAIVLAGIIIAITVYFVRTNQPITVEGDPAAVRPLSPSDHIIGNPEAPVVVVEYADIDSSYGKDLQATMAQLMTEYAAGNQVAWVYRHFPVVDKHPNAAKHAEAAECAASLGNADAFWRFIDLLQASAPGEAQFDPEGYGAVATQLGIDPAALGACISAHTFGKRVADDAVNALAAGADGSPFSVLLVRGQEPTTIDGVLPYASMKKIIDQAVAKSGSTTP